jgi:hypothetical protein
LSHRRAVPLTKEARAFVRALHRHHSAPAGSVFQVGAADGDDLVGVVIVGRPVARRLDDGLTMEAVRCCTDGGRNACSFLYGQAWRVCVGLGFLRLVTYSLPAESGSSLRGAGWTQVAITPGRSWSCPSRPRSDKHPLGAKLRWEKQSPAFGGHGRVTLPCESGDQESLFAALQEGA